MDNELQKKKTDAKGKNKSIGLILFSSLAILLLLIGELYVMIVMDGMLLEVALVGIAILVFAYLDLTSIIKWIHANEEDREEQYAGMLKAEKASYLLIRKYFDEIEEQLALMEDKISDPFQEIVAAQKATAKVTINRNKENTDALMNSNDKLLDIIFGMESKIEEMSGLLSGRAEDGSKNDNKELVQKQIEMSNQMRELELNLKNEIFEAVSKLSSISKQVVMAPPQAAPMQQMPTPADIEPLGDLGDLGDLGELEDFATLEADVPMELTGEGLEENAVSMPESTPELEPIPEPIPEPEQIFESAPEPELTPQSISELEPELLPMPDLSDPDRDLSSDELDGLLANIAAEEASLTTEPEPEPQPEPEPEPEVKELPPMPDLSDPNRAMSPDEIAALFANLG